ncbi:MAG: hypothetical protein GY711_30445 [bacterium]|nr:hypothetical protein [bacterium]
MKIVPATLLVFAIGPSVWAQAPVQTLWLTSGPRLYRIDGYDTPGPTPQLIGLASGPVTDVAVHPADGRIFAVRGTDDDTSFYEVSRTTGARTLIALLPVIGGNALDFDVNGELYLRCRDGLLYRVDLLTGALSPIGTTGQLTMGDIAFDVDGTILGSIDGRRLDRVDPATGQSTVIGMMNISRGAHGLEIDCDGTVYAFTGPGDVYTVDTATAGVTLLYNLSLPDQVSGVAFELAAPCRPGVVFCSPAIPNSTGMAATITSEGSRFVADNDLTLIASGLPPGELGYFIVGSGTAQQMPPASQGVVCIAGAPTGRFLQAGQILLGPTGSIAVDLTALPLTPLHAVQPGETWNFQCWYRDLASSNYTDAVGVLFQ